MSRSTTITTRFNRTTNSWLAVMITGSLYVTGCSKSLEVPVAANAKVIETIKETPQLQASRSAIALLEGNAESTAVDFSWGAYNTNGYTEQYTLEAAVAGTSFADPVVLGSTAQTKISFNVQGFNNQLRQILIAGTQSRVEFRVRISAAQMLTVYSKAVAMDVTAYQPYRNINYDDAIRIPGNFQGWKLAGAPQIVSVNNNGEYEGYIDFTDAATEFMMLKGTDKWQSLRTFTDIGAGKFGFGGKVFTTKEGAGIYRFYANTNTNTWTLTKVNFWTLSGSAVIGNPQIQFDAKTKTWSSVVTLNAGEFVFRANNDNKIVLGHNIEEGVGTLGCGSGKIQVAKAGKFRVVVSVLTAGNYQYGIQRIQ